MKKSAWYGPILSVILVGCADKSWIEKRDLEALFLDDSTAVAFLLEHWVKEGTMSMPRDSRVTVGGYLVRTQRKSILKKLQGSVSMPPTAPIAVPYRLRGIIIADFKPGLILVDMQTLFQKALANPGMGRIRISDWPETGKVLIRGEESGFMTWNIGNGKTEPLSADSVFGFAENNRWLDLAFDNGAFYGIASGPAGLRLHIRSGSGSNQSYPLPLPPDSLGLDSNSTGYNILPDRRCVLAFDVRAFSYSGGDCIDLDSLTEGVADWRRYSYRDSYDGRTRIEIPGIRDTLKFVRTLDKSATAEYSIGDFR